MCELRSSGSGSPDAIVADMKAGLMVAMLFAGALTAQTVTTGYVYAGPTFGKHLDGAGRFGIGLDFSLAPHIDLGGEIGTIHKHDVGILASGNLTYHFSSGRSRARRQEWDPFLVGGVTGARISGIGGFYVNLGAGDVIGSPAALPSAANSRATPADRTLVASANSASASPSAPKLREDSLPTR